MMTDEKRLTGYPSIDKPWMKYYSDEVINDELPECTIYEYLYELNKDYKSSIALNYFGKKMTYGQLFDEIDKVANAFKQLGVRRGQVVTLVTLSCVNQVFCFYALNKIGAISNFVNVLANEEELKSFVKEGKSKIVISMDLFAEKVVEATKDLNVEKIIVYSLKEYMPFVSKNVYSYKTRSMDISFMKQKNVISWSSFMKCEKEDDVQIDGLSEDVCFLGHTGGTTGFPKSVLLTNRSFNSVAWQYVHTFTHERGEVFLSVMVPFVTYGSIVNIHMPLCLGLEVALVPKFEADKWASYVKKYNVVHLCAIPAYVAQMTEDENLAKMNLVNIKTVGMGGEGMNVPLENKINTFLEEHNSSARILKGYGMTEVCATASVEYDIARKVGSVGIPFIHNNFMIYDNEKQQELSYGQVGEICMQCLSMMSGYKDNKEETNILFKEHSDGSRWIHTGDLGYIDEDGFIFVEGRMKRMIMTINNGVVYKVFPSQIEEVLNEHNFVHESCVVGMKKGSNIVLKAYLVLELGCEDTRQMLYMELEQLCEKLAENQRPDTYEVLNEFPRTPAGKVDYRNLEAM